MARIRQVYILQTVQLVHLFKKSVRDTISVCLLRSDDLPRRLFEQSVSTLPFFLYFFFVDASLSRFSSSPSAESRFDVVFLA